MSTYAELRTKFKELFSRKGRGSIKAKEVLNLMIELLDKLFGIDVSATATIRKSYDTLLLANADKNPIDPETQKPIKLGQLISVVADPTVDNNAIYRLAALADDGTPTWERQAALGDMTNYTKSGGSNKTAKDLENDLIQLAGERAYRVIPFDTNAATTRTKVVLSERKTGLTIVYFTGTEIVTEQYKNTKFTDVEWVLDHNWEPIGRKAAAIYNVDLEKPLASGYYTPDMARAAVPVKDRKLGLIITFKVAYDKWVVEQYVFSDFTAWNNSSKWIRLIDGVAYEIVKHMELGLRKLFGKNLFSKHDTISGTLANNTGLVNSSPISFISNYIPISDSKKYILSGFQSHATQANRVMVFYDKYGKMLDTGWDSTTPYALNVVDGKTYPIGRSFYIFVPASQIAADWKTNGLATLPIPVGAAYIRFNTGTVPSYDWRDFFMLEETTEDTPSAYEPFGLKSENIVKTAEETAFDVRAKAIQDELYVTNKFDINKITNVKYLSSVDGSEKRQPDINGLSFAISDYIEVAGGKAYYISGRSTRNTIEGADTRAIIFYDSQNNLLKPVDMNGIDYPNYSVPNINGIVYAPKTAVKCRFAVMWHSTLEDAQNIMFLTSTQEPKEFIPYGSYIRKSIVVGNDSVYDGKIMVKKGDSFDGIDPADIATEEVIVDDIYVLKDYVAGSKARYHNFELVASNILPENGFALTDDGVLVYMKNGVRYNVNLTQE